MTEKGERSPMFGTKNNLESNKRLAHLSVEVVRASASNEREAEAVAASPFLFTRLRARIDAERLRREESEGWFALFGVFRRAFPAMALLAVFAFALFWTANLGTLATGDFGDSVLLGARDVGIEHVVFADRNPLSSDEVLASILNDDEREASR